MRLLPVLCLLMAAPLVAHADVGITTQAYLCDRGARLQASYLNVEARSFAVLAFEGRQLVFETAASGSGARYVSTDPAQPFVWWTKGDEAMLLHGSGDDEMMVYGACTPG